MTNAPDNCFMAPHHHLMERCGHCTYEWDPPVLPERVESATYTASEVKVLTETAGKVAYALGRKDAGEEIAAAIDDFQKALEDAYGKRGNMADDLRADAAEYCATIARSIMLQGPGATSDATSGVPGHQEVSDMLGGSGAPPRRDATYPVDDDHPEHCLCATCQEVSEAVRSPQEAYEHVHSNGPDAADCTTCEGNYP